MPRYYFNTRIGTDLVQDTEGEYLRDPDQAWETARALIRQVLREEGASPDLLKACLEVTDENGDVVLEFPFAEAMMPLPDGPQTRH
jgi:hypothetical protein